MENLSKEKQEVITDKNFKSNNSEFKRNEQIEEMARILCGQVKSCNECTVHKPCLMMNCATILTKKGFCRASEVAREIFEEIEKQLARYSHLHRYAEEAREVTEEYADGTPCEMTSVWEVISLHKNGWDDYETMCKLQDNIGNIEKSRLLKEFESDIAELKKKYIGKDTNVTTNTEGE